MKRDLSREEVQRDLHDHTFVQHAVSESVFAMSVRPTLHHFTTSSLHDHTTSPLHHFTTSPLLVASTAHVCAFLDCNTAEGLFVPNH